MLSPFCGITSIKSAHYIFTKFSQTLGAPLHLIFPVKDYASSHHRQEKVQDGSRCRGPLGGPECCHPRAVLARTPLRVSTGEVLRKPLRGELYRRGGEDAAEDDVSRRGPVDRGRLSQSSHRAGDRGAGKERRA